MGRVLDVTQLPAWDQKQDLEALVNRLDGELGGHDGLFVYGREKLTEAIARAWMMGANVALNTVEGLRVCRICGCWQLQACTERCSWVAHDLCSTCVPVAAQQAGRVTCGRCGRPASSPHVCEAC